MLSGTLSFPDSSDVHVRLGVGHLGSTNVPYDEVTTVTEHSRPLEVLSTV